MNNFAGLALFLIFGGAGLVSMFVILKLLLPGPIEQARTILDAGLGRSLLLGLVNFLFAGVLGVLLALPARNGGILAGICVFLIAIIVLLITVLTLFGLVAVTSMLGDRMGEAKSPVSSLLRGGALLVIACITPYLGWFVFTPLVLWTAFGAAIQTLFRKKEKVTQAN